MTALARYAYVLAVAFAIIHAPAAEGATDRAILTLVVFAFAGYGYWVDRDERGITLRYRPEGD